MTNNSQIDKPICTVLLITYNHEPYVAKCIESVLSQKTTYPYIIKIFDDASTDKSSEIILKYAAKYPQKIKAYISPKNIGAQANIWQAYKSVDTKYFILTETDDYWCDNKKLQLQIEALEHHTDCSFCCTNNIVKVIEDKYLKFKDGKPEIAPDRFNKQIISFADIDKMPSGFLTHISTRLVRTSCINLDSLKYKETFLFDASQFFYLIIQGNMYWIDKICSVYVKTGTGTWSSAGAATRIGTYLTAMSQLNEDTNYKIWKKIIQQINLVGNYWVNLDNQLYNQHSISNSSNPNSVPQNLSHTNKIKSRYYFLGIPLFKSVQISQISALQYATIKKKIYIFGVPCLKLVNKNNITIKYYLFGIATFGYKYLNNLKTISLFGLPILKIKY